MIDAPRDRSDEEYPFLDVLLREALPEIKLALGELIDRENARALPSKYARLLPESLLVVTLRPAAAETLAPLASSLERDLSDSCTRHGSLFDRTYRVQLRRAEDPDAALYQVSAFAGHQPAVQADRAGAVEDRTVARAPAGPLPVADPDATRLGDDVGIPGWQPGRWVLVVEDDQGAEKEAFRLTDAYTTVGRRTDDPDLQTTVGLSDVPQVSRRQLALIWEERDGAPGFKVYNVGLNPLRLPGQEIPGAHVGKGPLRLDRVAEKHTGWLPPGVSLRIGDQGPNLRVEEVPPDEEEEASDADAGGEPARDPDATVFE